jgi:hypothetical protein
MLIIAIDLNSAIAGFYLRLVCLFLLRIRDPNETDGNYYNYQEWPHWYFLYKTIIAVETNSGKKGTFFVWAI